MNRGPSLISARHSNPFFNAGWEHGIGAKFRGLPSKFDEDRLSDFLGKVLGAKLTQGRREHEIDVPFYQ